MSDRGVDAPRALSEPFDRRQVLKRAAVVGGVVWATPALQALSVRAADAASHPTVPPPPPPPPPPSVVTGLPSHGLALVTCDNLATKPFAVKIDSGNPTVVTGVNSSQTQDAAQLNEQYGAGNWRQPTAQELQHFTSSGVGVYDGQQGLFITIPSGCSFLSGFAYTFDGSFGPSGKKDPGCGDGDKYTNAFLSGNAVWFVVRCNEPATGE